MTTVREQWTPERNGIGHTPTRFKREQWTPERNAIGHTPTRFKREQSWDPMATSSVNFCRKTRIVPFHAGLVRQRCAVVAMFCEDQQRSKLFRRLPHQSSVVDVPVRGRGVGEGVGEGGWRRVGEGLAKVQGYGQGWGRGLGQGSGLGLRVRMQGVPSNPPKWGGGGGTHSTTLSTFPN
jgi:hypothetical protein